MNRTSSNCVPILVPRDSRVHLQLKGRVQYHRDRLGDGTEGARGKFCARR